MLTPRNRIIWMNNETLIRQYAKSQENYASSIISEVVRALAKIAFFLVHERHESYDEF